MELPLAAKDILIYYFKLRHPRYSFVGNRHQLRRVLGAALTDPHLDYHKDLAVLAATLLAVTVRQVPTPTCTSRHPQKVLLQAAVVPHAGSKLTSDHQGSQGQAAMIISSYQRVLSGDLAVRSAIEQLLDALLQGAPE